MTDEDIEIRAGNVNLSIGPKALTAIIAIISSIIHGGFSAIDYHAQAKNIAVLEQRVAALEHAIKIGCKKDESIEC